MTDDVDDPLEAFEETELAERLTLSVFETLHLLGPEAALQAWRFTCRCATVVVTLGDRQVFTGQHYCAEGKACRRPDPRT